MATRGQAFVSFIRAYASDPRVPEASSDSRDWTRRDASKNASPFFASLRTSAIQFLTLIAPTHVRFRKPAPWVNLMRHGRGFGLHCRRFGSHCRTVGSGGFPTTTAGASDTIIDHEITKFRRQAQRPLAIPFKITSSAGVVRWPLPQSLSSASALIRTAHHPRHVTFPPLHVALLFMRSSRRCQFSRQHQFREADVIGRVSKLSGEG